MRIFSQIESEFIRSSLYGEGKKRRETKLLLPLLESEYGESYDTKIASLKSIVAYIIELGKDAETLAKSGCTEDTLEYDQLEKRAEKYQDFSKQWMHKCFMENKILCNQAAPVKIDSSSLQDLCKSIQGNALHTKRETVSVQELEIKKKMNMILNFRTWQNDFDMMRDLNATIKEICKVDVKAGEKAQKLLAQGKDIAALLQSAFRAGTTHNPSAVKVLENEAKKLSATPLELKSIQRQFDKGQKRAQEFKKARKEEFNFPKPDFDMYGPNPFFIGNLLSCSHWTVMIDETGKVFDQGYFDSGTSSYQKGRFAALLIPDGSGLPAIGSFHSTDSETKDILHHLETLLHNKIRCGIIGVTLDGMVSVPMNYWYNGLERLFDLIFRLLPVKESSELNFLIENRGTSQEKIAQRCADASLFRLAKSDAEKAAKIKATVQLFEKKKTNNKQFLAYNGYVDAIACAWNGKRQNLVRVLKDYGLKYTCLLEGNTQDLYEIMDEVHTGRLPEAILWTNLLCSPDSGKSDSLTSRLLCEIGYLLKNDISKWTQYLEFCLGHLDSKAINLRSLGKQVSFLKLYQPEESKLPSPLRLIWLTAKLAESNHRGTAVVQSMKEFTTLIHDLYEEDAPLTCWATLHLAVNFTNAYEFEKANKTIENYLALISKAVWGKNLPQWIHSVFDVLMTSLNMEPCSPAAIPGLRYYAQLISSHGQHEAFFGRNEKAVEFFSEAIRLFSKLSSADKDLEISQTSAYLLTSLMDMQCPDMALFNKTAKTYFGSNLKESFKKISAGKAYEDKYRHHIMLRGIVSNVFSQDLRNTVLEEKKNWKCGEGHPWEMIEFYRALLVSTKEDRLKHLRKAHELSQGYDATLHVIDAVIMGSIFLDDSSVKKEYLTLVERCERELPALGKRVRILKDQISVKRSPLELAKLVLPFNFR